MGLCRTMKRMDWKSIAVNVVLTGPPSPKRGLYRFGVSYYDVNVLKFKRMLYRKIGEAREVMASKLEERLYR